MSTITLLSLAISIYAVVTGIFLISENRRPQSTLAWMLAFIFAPGLGVVLYFLFGRNRKAFAKQNKLLSQGLDARLVPALAATLEREECLLKELAKRGPSQRKLLLLITRNSFSFLTSRNEVEIQQDASTYYPALMKDIEKARHSIHLQTFIWRVDAFTDRLKDLLEAKVREGVTVRLLYDPVGSFLAVTPGYLRRMRAAGIQMVATSPLWHLHTISYRNHRKISVIDGKIGYLGGMNLGQEHLDGGAYGAWRDTQLRLQGEAAALLQAIFLVDWYNATGEDLFNKVPFVLEPPVSSTASVPVQILTSGPDSRWEATRQQYEQMIVAAKQHVYIQTPYFILDSSIAEVLSIAAMSGTDIKVMLSAPGPLDRIAGWAANTFIADVLKAGVRVFFHDHAYLHAKTVSIDSEICSIGSANFDIRSFSINYELNAIIYSEHFASKLEAAFERDLANCREVTLEEYQQRPLLSRFRDSTARLFSPLL